MQHCWLSPMDAPLRDYFTLHCAGCNNSLEPFSPSTATLFRSGADHFSIFKMHLIHIFERTFVRIASNRTMAQKSDMGALSSTIACILSVSPFSVCLYLCPST